MKRFRKILKHQIVPHRGNAFRPHALRHKSLSLYLFALFIFQIALGITFYSGPEVKGVDSSKLKKDIVNMVNLEREKVGRPTVYESPALNEAAEDKLQDMFSKNYWDHTGPSGETAWRFIVNRGYQYELAGENLARGFSSSEGVMRAWMKSPTHRDNILNPRFQEVGLAVGSGKINNVTTTVIVQFFGKPKLAFASEKSGAVFAGEVTAVPKVGLENITLPSRTPYFIAWVLIFGLIVLDGIMLRKLGLHTSSKHLKSFRVAITMSIVMLVMLSIGIAAIL